MSEETPPSEKTEAEANADEAKVHEAKADEAKVDEAKLGAAVEAHEPPPDLDAATISDEPVPPEATEDHPDELPPDPGSADAASPRLQSIVESLLFAADKPLTLKQLGDLLGE